MMSEGKKIDGFTKYELTLSEEEAQVLKDILGWVGGLPTESRRGIADRISETFSDLGIPYTDCKDISGSIYFKEKI